MKYSNPKNRIAKTAYRLSALATLTILILAMLSWPALPEPLAAAHLPRPDTSFQERLPAVVTLHKSSCSVTIQARANTSFGSTTPAETACVYGSRSVTVRYLADRPAGQPVVVTISDGVTRHATQISAAGKLYPISVINQRSFGAELQDSATSVLTGSANPLPANANGQQAAGYLWYPPAAATSLKVTGLLAIPIPAAGPATSVVLQVSKITSMRIANSLSYQGPASAAKASQAKYGITATQSITTSGNPTVSSHATQPVTLRGSQGYTWTNPKAGQSVTVIATSNMPKYSTTWGWAKIGSQLTVVKSVSATYSPPYTCKTYSRTARSSPTVLRSLDLHLPKRETLAPLPTPTLLSVVDLAPQPRAADATVALTSRIIPAPTTATTTWTAQNARISGNRLVLAPQPGVVVVTAKSDGMTCAAAISVAMSPPPFPWWLLALYAIFAASILRLVRYFTRAHKQQHVKERG